jgi:hypothetical protein
MEDLDERSGMNSKDHNEELRRKRKQRKSLRRYGRQVKKVIEKEIPLKNLSR